MTSAILRAWRGQLRLPSIECPKPIRTSQGAWARRLARGANQQRTPKADGLELCRRRGLRREFEPTLLVPIGRDRFARVHWLTPQAAQALAGLRKAALGAGIDLEVISSYRSVRAQQGIVARKLRAGQTLAEIFAVNAPPGYSEHHSGECVDFAVPGAEPLTEAFDTTPAFAWLAREAPKFGWRMSYPRGNLQGYVYEPWHWRFRPTRQRRQKAAAKHVPLSVLGL